MGEVILKKSGPFSPLKNGLEASTYLEVQSVSPLPCRVFVKAELGDRAEFAEFIFNSAGVQSMLLPDAWVNAQSFKAVALPIRKVK
jgi:hypothetical protein